MSTLTRAPVLKPFTLALIQLGNVGANKAENLKHAREMIQKAATNHGSNKKPDLIVLPVCTTILPLSLIQIDQLVGMLQFAVRGDTFPDICRKDWVYTWEAV